MLFRLPLCLGLLALTLWLLGDARAAHTSPAMTVAPVAGGEAADTRVAVINIRGNLRASAFSIGDDAHLRVGGLRRLHVLNPRVPSVRIEIQSETGRVLASSDAPTFLRDGEQWVDIPLQPGQGPLTVTLSR